MEKPLKRAAFFISYYPCRTPVSSYGFFFRSRIVAFSVRLLLIKTS